MSIPAPEVPKADAGGQGGGVQQRQHQRVARGWRAARAAAKLETSNGATHRPAARQASASASGWTLSDKATPASAEQRAGTDDARRE